MEEKKPLIETDKRSFSDTFDNLFAESEFKLTMILVFTSTLGLKFVGTLLSIYYIKVWEVDDGHAGIILALSGTQIFFFLTSGMLIEKYGIKTTYLVGFFVMTLEFLLLIIVKNFYFQVILISLGFGFTATLISGSLKSSIKETTKIENRSLGFSIYNLLYNFSAITLGLIAELIFRLKGINFVSFNILFLIIVGVSAINFIIVVFFSKLKKNENSNERIELSHVLTNKNYWKTITVFLISSIPLGCIYLPGIMLPIYMDRELGTTEGYGYYYALYSFMLGVFGIFLNFISKIFKLYDCVILGGLIIAAGPLVFALGNDYYVIGVYITITAIGGSIFEPRLIDYNGYAATKGCEGHFFGIGSIGYAFSLVFCGFMSGFLLNKFCPEDGKRESCKMWLIVSAFCAGGSILLLALRSWIEIIKDQQEDQEIDQQEALLTSTVEIS